ncbi:MAG: 5-(carboxyamino)imidazole ribonucleotide synthase [Candidatus Contendobacter sp.]|nr:5-(carboxyamino)imidazole ribonucleotide synthase [Candidatus Contendobacter sp.]MDG4558901.1 5-(carboxyamino)imidazole ribonucleotide synthase [Candidatus Contendobacter sp.]
MNVGIVGGGQLARMLALAGYPLNLRFQVLDPAADACAGQVATLLRGDYDAEARLEQLAEWAEVVTFDFENVPATAALALEREVAVYPPPGALATAQDRVSEKTLFWELGIPTPPFATVSSLEELRRAVTRIELPAVLKTRRLGYDGKGQRILRAPEDVDSAWRALSGAPLILEGFVLFEREVSVLAARGRDGATAFYPLVENHHRDGILRLSRAPCPEPELEREGWNYARRLLDRLNYVGLLAIEFFVKEGRLIANEMAPRVHNSGHWTIEGAETSQFENHLRAILGLPLGSTVAIGHAAMVNCIGAMPDRTVALTVAGTHYHAYGKAPRPGRKVGHLTLRTDDPSTLAEGLKRLLPLVGLGPDAFG